MRLRLPVQFFLSEGDAPVRRVNGAGAARSGTARAALAPKAWLPFGNGERSCIGRAFALQEATVVLAMLLQRCTFWLPAPYELQIKETLTMKPDGLMIRARRRRPIKRGTAPRPSAAGVPVVSPLAAGRAVAAHRTPLLVLYGSNSGSSEAFARRIASDGEARGYVTRVAPLDDHAGKLAPGRAVAIVTASPPARTSSGWRQATRVRRTSSTCWR